MLNSTKCKYNQVLLFHLADEDCTNIRTFQEGYVIEEKNFLVQNVTDYKVKALNFSEISYLEYD